MRSGCVVGWGIGKVKGKYEESSSMDMVGVEVINKAKQILHTVPRWFVIHNTYFIADYYYLARCQTYSSI